MIIIETFLDGQYVQRLGDAYAKTHAALRLRLDPLAVEIRENLVIDGVLQTPSPEYTAHKLTEDAAKAEAEAKALRESQATEVIKAGFSLNGKVTPIADIYQVIQLAEAGKRIISAADVATTTATIGSMSGTYEATLGDLNKILAGLETIRSNSIKVELGELIFEDVQAPLEL